MQKTVMALIAATCLSGTAFAQTAPATTTDPATAPATAPATPGMATEGAATATPGMANEGGFLTYQEANQLLGSGLMNANVRGADNENIGTVSDLVLDRDGQVIAVVVGVGGFLGIGQKNVAILDDELEFVLSQDVAAEAGTTATAPATGAATAPATGMTAAPADTTAATGTATAPAATTPAAPAAGTAMAPEGAASGTGMSGTVATGTDSAFGWTGAGIDHIRVSYTREQLNEAPAFETAE